MKAKVVNIIDKNTIKVTVTDYKKHPRYGKYITVHKNYLVESLGKEVSIGDEIEMKSSRPISKLKKWVLI
ncbi:MAG: ribosomal protein S17 [Proteobacteria bacterium]|jgi:small subunit ribosomal protein S17|nr:ribosomal protein S17 [Pseudomonadota bacterium]